jgi:hypothetical protein
MHLLRVACNAVTGRTLIGCFGVLFEAALTRASSVALKSAPINAAVCPHFGVASGWQVTEANGF